jgi:perosamine synthetase
MAELALRGIATRRGVMAIHLEPYYRERYAGLRLPVTERCTAETMLLPLFPGLTDDEQRFVADSLLEAGADAIKQSDSTDRRDALAV